MAPTHCQFFKGKFRHNLNPGSNTLGWDTICIVVLVILKYGAVVSMWLSVAYLISDSQSRLKLRWNFPLSKMYFIPYQHGKLLLNRKSSVKWFWDMFSMITSLNIQCTAKKTL